MKLVNITFIGAGNMARAIINGLLSNGFDKNYITVTNPSWEKLIYFKENLKLHTDMSNVEGAKKAEVIVICVKPDHIQEVCKEMAPIIKKNNPLVISIAAGVPTKLIRQWLSKGIALVRVMPNMPAMVNAGVTALFANENVSNSQKETTESIFRAVGIVLWLSDEKLMDWVTALSGSGPAYFFLMIEAMQELAKSQGFSDEQARLLTLQTALGSAKIAIETDKNIIELRKAITSKKGTTERGIEILEEGHFRELINKAITKASERAKEISELLTNNGN